MARRIHRSLLLLLRWLVEAFLNRSISASAERRIRLSPARFPERGLLFRCFLFILLYFVFQDLLGFSVDYAARVFAKVRSLPARFGWFVRSVDVLRSEIGGALGERRIYTGRADAKDFALLVPP